MTQVHSKFSSGQELANSVVTSRILCQLCKKISESKKEINQNEPLGWKVFPESNCTTITFVDSRNVTQQCPYLEERELVPLSSFPEFQFLCSKVARSFSIHKAAVTLFYSVKDRLSTLKEEYGDLTRPLIITGHCLGGSVATLFALWLLKNINKAGTKRVRPLCITFGAPLIGDQAFQQVMSNFPIANSCFLHVAANTDMVPRLFLSRPPNNDRNAMDIDSQTEVFKPFGTFLLCSDAGYTCADDPVQVSESLKAMGLKTGGRQWQVDDYERMVDHLMSIALVKGTSRLGEIIKETLGAGIVLELEAIGVERTQEIGKLLIANLEERKKSLLVEKNIDPSRKLNMIKINMARMEWYKKSCKNSKIGYYDSFKKDHPSQMDMDVNVYCKNLTNYWKEMVDEAAKKPQTEEAAFRTRYLFAGTNYRRMIEPLDIANFYKAGNRGYLKNGRSPHYEQLEDWHNDELAKDALEQVTTRSSSTGSNNARKQKVAEMLTTDSCFWAHVEEALLDCKSIGVNKFFEAYVMKEINRVAVSPEIFLGGSSFMQWWREYEGIVEATSHSSELTRFMKNKLYDDYKEGRYPKLE